MEQSMKSKKPLPQSKKYYIVIMMMTSFLIAVILYWGCSNASDKEAATKSSNHPISYTLNSAPDRYLTNTEKAPVQYLPLSSKQSHNQKKINAKTSSNSVKKKLIAIDAGHQSRPNTALEPIGPGAKIKKPKVSSGTRGIASGVTEYKLNLIIAKKVQKELIRRGYRVYMIRTTNHVNLSNKQRADMANKSGADLFIRIHADSIANSSITGASTLYPSKNNPYVSSLSSSSYSLSKAIIKNYCKKTGIKNRGAITRNDMSGINWCKIPVTIIEMGFLSNRQEDLKMQTKSMQTKMAEGICDGIDDYFAYSHRLH